MIKTTRAVMVLFFLLSMGSTAWGSAPQLEADALWPAISLPVPSDQAQRNYLGVKAGGSFTIGDMPAEVVVVQIFSMYCPICQREAPRVNQLYTLIGRRGSLKQKVKIIGIGAGNSAYEVSFFQRSYSIPFPLFADDDFEIHKKVGEVRTPHFFVLKHEQDGKVRLVFAHSGGFKSPESFLQEIIKRCGLQ